MTYPSYSDAINGFRSDADRANIFGNGDANATYTSRYGVIVPSIQNLIWQWNAQINVAANGILAQSTAQAGVATTQAGTATAQAGAATASAAAAQTAKTAAESARDASLIQAGVYATEVAGRAAVADGVAFKVQGSGAVAAYEYRRVNSGSSTLIGSYPSADFAQKIGSPFLKSISATNAAADATLYGNLLRGVIDVKLYGLPPTDSYYIERVRRNLAGSWHIVIKRASDNASVLQFLGALTEPSDPTAEHRVLLPSVVTGAIGYIVVRWSEFTAGATNSGLTMTLSPDCVNRTLATPESAMPRTAARVGQVPLTADPTAFVTVDEAARTVTWPELRIVDGRSNNFGYFKLAAGSVTFTAPLQVAYLDLVQAATYAGGAAIPASAVVLGTYGIEDPSGAGYYGSAHQFPIAWSPGVGRVDLNPMLRVAPPAATTVYRDDIVVKRDIANNVISIFMRASGNDLTSLTYIRYDLFHYVSASLADVWTIYGVFEVQRTGYESFSGGKELLTPVSEILCALQEQGMGDFMGGRAHGNEAVTQTPTLLIDGRSVDLASTTLAYFHGAEVSFFQSSVLYRYGTALGTPLANRHLWLRFNQRDMYADQRIEHVASYTLQAGYMAMLAPHRYSVYTGSSEDNTSSQISGKFIDNARTIPIDISSQAAAIGSDYQMLTPPITKVKMFGTYGIECEMESLGTSDPSIQSVFFMQRAQYAYNKAYIGFIGSISGNQAVTPTTKWQVKTRWRFASKN